MHIICQPTNDIKKMDKLARKSEVRKQLGNQAGAQKYQTKARKQSAKYEKARQLYERSTQASAVLQKKRLTTYLMAH